MRRLRVGGRIASGGRIGVGSPDRRRRRIALLGRIALARRLALASASASREAVDALQAGELIALLQPDEAHALGVAADHRDVLAPACAPARRSGS